MYKQSLSDKPRARQFGQGKVCPSTKILLFVYSETEGEDRQLVEDTYQCISSLFQRSLGQYSLVRESLFLH